MKEYLSTREAAEKWGISERRVNQYCAEERIPGAQRFGTSWAIPASAEKPSDPRKKNHHTQTLARKSLKRDKLYPDFMPLISTALNRGNVEKPFRKSPQDPKKILPLRNITISAGRRQKPCERQNCT